MSESPEEQHADVQADEVDDSPAPEELGEPGKRALDAMKAERNAARKELRTLQAELEKVRQASMSEQERAVAEAEARGRAAALAQSGTRLARAELRAAAKGRVDDGTLAGFLEYADLAKFVGADGEPDDKAIAAAVKKLAGTSTPDFDGGARGSAAAPSSMDQLIRRAAGVV